MNQPQSSLQQHPSIGGHEGEPSVCSDVPLLHAWSSASPPRSVLKGCSCNLHSHNPPQPGHETNHLCARPQVKDLPSKAASAPALPPKLAGSQVSQPWQARSLRVPWRTSVACCVHLAHHVRPAIPLTFPCLFLFPSSSFSLSFSFSFAFPFSYPFPFSFSCLLFLPSAFPVPFPVHFQCLPQCLSLDHVGGRAT